MSNALVFIHAGFVGVTNFHSLSSLAMACYPLPVFLSISVLLFSLL